MTSPAAVRKILDEYGLKARRGLGQNFLVDGNILRKMVDSLELEPGQLCLEIGPGLGALTQELLRRGARVLAVETDRYLIPWLERLFSDCPGQLCVLNQDILEIDIEAEMAKAFGGPFDSFMVCANIPYQITTPIIFKLLEECPRMSSATLMMQKEVAERILARPGGKDYGRLTVAIAYHGRVWPITAVSKNCYYPRPEVDSVVLRLEPYSDRLPCQDFDERAFKAFLAYAFQHRRKTLSNICVQHFGRTRDDIEQQLEFLGLDPRLRPENLELQDFISLISHMGKIK